MQALRVYDPPMCCSTGVCGPEIDPKRLVRRSTSEWRKPGVAMEDMREAVRIGEAVKAGSAKHILAVADRLIGHARKVSDAKACCEGSKAPEQKTSCCC